MKFDAKMAKEIADCWNEIENNWDLIIPNLFTYASNGRYSYSTSNDNFEELRYRTTVICKDELEALSFKVEIDEDMKIAKISW